MALILSLLGAEPAAATPGTGDLEALYSFSRAAGANPLGGLTPGADGNFYGVATQGGTYGMGAVFKVTPSGTLSPVASFNGSNGKDPQGPLLLAGDGNFYGTATNGGSADEGVVFKLTSGGTLTALASFPGGATGSFPGGGLVQGSDGNFYGTTDGGGSSDTGTVFKVTPSGTLSLLASFPATSQAPSGAGPLLLASDGNFYGTTVNGGAYSSGVPGPVGYGAVFKLTPAGVLTILASFNFVDGANPTSGVIQGSDGNFYGTTTVGGSNGGGTLFEVTPSGTITTLYNFPQGFGGSPTSPLLLAADGNFYGTTEATLFRFTSQGVFSTLAQDQIGGDTSNGAGFLSRLIQDSAGNFYGTASTGGPNSQTAINNDPGDGVVFKYIAGGALGTLAAFGAQDGEYPSALVSGSDGNFYGATSAGGIGNLGTLFRITPAGVLTTLVSFDGSNGANNALGSMPPAYVAPGLVQGSDGNFYGATYAGGAGFSSTDAGYGTVYQLTPDGTLTTLLSFSGADGANPIAALTQGSDGNFYGATSLGGTYFAGPPPGAFQGYGTVFKITPAGSFTSLLSFEGATDGASDPGAPLLQGADGNFYSTFSVYPYGSGYGGVYSVSPAGALDVLAQFGPGTSGNTPNSGLSLGSDGNFYGTNSQGGSSGSGGTAFKITPSGAFTLLAEFNSATGTQPQGDLLLGGDGSLYGTTTADGAHGYGSIFRLSPDGTLNAIASFDKDNGDAGTGLLLGKDGNFYGTASFGGSDDRGTIFRLIVPAAPTGLTATAGAEDVTLSWTAVAGASGYNVYQGTASGAEGTKPVASVTSAGTTISGLTAGTTYYFTVTSLIGNGESVFSNEASATPDQGSGSTTGGGTTGGGTTGGGTSGGTTTGSSGGGSGGGGAGGPELLLPLLLAVAARRRRG